MAAQTDDKKLDGAGLGTLWGIIKQYIADNPSIPKATASVLGGIMVGTTLAIDNSGVLDLASGIVTAGTYKSVTVDTYGRVTAGSNPNTLQGYGITDAKIDNGAIILGADSITPATQTWVQQQGYTSNIGTVTQVKVGTSAYDPSSGIVSLPAYPTTLPASDVYNWAKAATKPSYTASEVGAATSDHTHTTTIATSSGTNQITLAFGTKYAITAGGTSYVFTMPANPDTWRPLGTGATDACAGNDSRLSNSRPASDVYSWAKASSKPSYSWSEISSRPTKVSQFTNDSGYITSSGSCNYATSAGSAGNADTTDGLHVHGGRNNEANKIVRTDGNGYIQCGWIDTTSGGFYPSDAAIGRVYCSDDTFIRWLSPSVFISRMGLATSSQLSNYLPLSGGRLSNNLSVECTDAAVTVATPGKSPISLHSGSSGNCGLYGANWLIRTNSSGNTYMDLGEILVTSHISSTFFQLYNSSTNPYLKLYIGGGNPFYIQAYNDQVAMGSTGAKSIYVNSFGNGGIAGTWSQGSDGRYKTITGYIDLKAEQIASMPAILYRWNDRDDMNVYAGSIAQNWEGILPQVVDVNNDVKHFRNLQYGVAALVSAICVAKETVTLKEKVALLETRVKALEDKVREYEAS